MMVIDILKWLFFGIKPKPPQENEVDLNNPEVQDALNIWGDYPLPKPPSPPKPVPSLDTLRGDLRKSLSVHDKQKDKARELSSKLNRMRAKSKKAQRELLRVIIKRKKQNRWDSQFKHEVYLQNKELYLSITQKMTQYFGPISSIKIQKSKVAHVITLKRKENQIVKIK